jgi:RNA polymerase sigma-70 factor (ECF subfamily)
MHAIRHLRNTAAPAPSGIRARRGHPAVGLMRGAGGTSRPCPEPCLQAIAASGDRAAFAALFRHFAPRVKSWLLRQGAAPGLAEDLAQETMLAVWRKAASFDARRAGAATWIFTIARNLRIDALRREATGHPAAVLEADLASGEPAADLVLLTNEAEAALRVALRSLPPEQRQVVNMSFLRGLAHGEIERELSIPLGTVKSRLRLAMVRLRAALDAGA